MLERVDTCLAPPPAVLALLNQLASFPATMGDPDTYIQVHVEHERKRLAALNPSSSFAINGRTQTWMLTIENAPRSIEAIQTLMDTKEVEMNKVSDVSELQRLDWEWSALEWLQSIIRQMQGKEQQRQQLLWSK